MGSKANRCSPELNPRAVVPERRSALATWSTSAATGGVSAVVDRSANHCPCRLRAPSSRHTVVGSVDGGGARASTPAVGAGMRRTAEQREGHRMSNGNACRHGRGCEIQEEERGSLKKRND